MPFQNLWRPDNKHLQNSKIKNIHFQLNILNLLKISFTIEDKIKIPERTCGQQISIRRNAKKKKEKISSGSREMLPHENFDLYKEMKGNGNGQCVHKHRMLFSTLTYF